MPSDRPPTPPAELHWFPFYVKDFMASPSVMRMSDAEVGRYLRLMLLAFGNGKVEPSLEKTDLEGASDRVKGMFSDRNGRLYNETLSRVWKEQQARHTQAVIRGKKSGAARKKGKRLETVLKPGRTAEPNRGEQAPMDMVLREGRDSLSRGAGAVPDGGPAPASSGVSERREAGGKPASLREILGNLIPRPA